MGPPQERKPLVLKRKLVIAREFLPILRVVSEEGRLSILEAVTNSPEQPVSMPRVRKELEMGSSFFKFASELATYNLIRHLERGWAERTEFGVSTLEMLSLMNDRLEEMRFAQLRAGYQRLGYSSQEIDKEVERARAIADARRTGSSYTLQP